MNVNLDGVSVFLCDFIKCILTVWHLSLLFILLVFNKTIENYFGIQATSSAFTGYQLKLVKNISNRVLKRRVNQTTEYYFHEILHLWSD